MRTGGGVVVFMGRHSICLVVMCRRGVPYMSSHCCVPEGGCMTRCTYRRWRMRRMRMKEAVSIRGAAPPTPQGLPAQPTTPPPGGWIREPHRAGTRGCTPPLHHSLSCVVKSRLQRAAQFQALVVCPGACRPWQDAEEGGAGGGGLRQPLLGPQGSQGGGAGGPSGIPSPKSQGSGSMRTRQQ
jgi:hypothetical protein